VVSGAASDFLGKSTAPMSEVSTSKPFDGSRLTSSCPSCPFSCFHPEWHPHSVSS
jgi:hypothetical protein